jgi:hypothetical protein
MKSTVRKTEEVELLVSSSCYSSNEAIVATTKIEDGHQGRGNFCRSFLAPWIGRTYPGPPPEVEGLAKTNFVGDEVE